MGTCVTTDVRHGCVETAPVASAAPGYRFITVPDKTDMCLTGPHSTPVMIVDDSIREPSCIGLHGLITSQVPTCSGNGKKFCAFLSHHKRACEMEARFLKGHLEMAFGFGSEVFVDSDDLQDMRLLLSHVRDSDCIVLLLSSEVLIRPLCILELCTAIEAAVPIVAVSVRGKGYEYADARRCLTFLDSEVDRRNPGAAELLRSNGLTPLDAAYLLSSVIPNIVSVEMNPCASKNVLHGSLGNIVEMIRNASPVLISTSKLEWIESRDALASSLGLKQDGTPEVARPATGSSRVGKLLICAPVPPGVPLLPTAYARRSVLETSVKKALFAPPLVSTAIDIGALLLHIHGPSGCGKTIFSSAIARDQEVREHFDKVCFVSVSQHSDLLDLQITLYRQLSDQHMDFSAINTTEMGRALSDAIACKTASTLLVVDGAGSAEQVEALCGWLPTAGNVGGTSARCAVLLTSRTPFPELASIDFPLCAMSPDEAVALLLEACDGRVHEPPFSIAAHGAAAECEWLPLILVIAGGFLDQYIASGRSGNPAVGATVTNEFVELLRGQAEHQSEKSSGNSHSCGSASVYHAREAIDADEGSASRVHLAGDTTGPLSRVIQATLNHCSSRRSDGMVRLFHSLVIFPEGAIIPSETFDVFAGVFAESGSHAETHVRSWLMKLLRLGLVHGSLAEGVWQHKSIREVAAQRAGCLRATQRRFVERLLSAQPDGGWPSFGHGTPGTAGAVGSGCHTVEGYVARHAWWHVQEAFAPDPKNMGDGTCSMVDGDFLAQLAASDSVLANACAVGLGHNALLAFAEQAEMAGKFISAAQLLRACALPSARSCPPLKEEQEMLFRARRLLQNVPVDMIMVAEQLELEILGRLVVVVPEGPVSAELRARRKELVCRRRDSGGETADEALLDSLSYCADAGAILGCFDGKMCGKEVDRGQIPRAIDLWINSASRCADAAKLFGDVDPIAVSVARCVGLHHLATVWGVGARGFIDSGVLDELGGMANLVDSVRSYEHCRDHKRFYEFQKLNVVIDGLHVLPLLSLGRITEAVECVGKCCLIWDAHFRDINNGETRQTHAHELWLCCQSVLPALVRLNMRQARKLAESLRLLRWNSSTCRLVWDQAVRTWSSALGGETNSFTLLQTFLNLQSFVIDPSVASKEIVCATLQARQSLLDMSNTSWDMLVLEWGMLETAAFAAERLGDDDLAEWYGDRGLERYDGLKLGVVAALLSLKARILERRGQMEEAQTCRQRAASLAIKAGQPLQVFNLIGINFQADETIDLACRIMLRERDEVMRELASVTGKAVL